MNKTIVSGLLTRVKIVTGIAICLFLVKTSLKAVDRTEPNQVKIDSDILVMLMEGRKNALTLRAKNLSTSPIRVKCNIPSLPENHFVGFPISAAIQIKNSKGDVLKNSCTDKKGWWKPSSMSSTIHPKWLFIRELHLGAAATSETSVDPTEALNFAKTLKLFGSDDIGEIRVAVDIVTESEGSRIVQRVYSPWFRTQNKD